MVHRKPDPDVTAVVICRDDEERVGHAIRRLGAHLRALGLHAEILAVDEHSGDNTVSLLTLLRRELPELKVVAGVAPGRGFLEAARRARGRSLVLLDARCDSPLAPLGFALARLDAGMDALAVSGRLLVLHRTRAHRAFDALLHRRDSAELHQRFLRRARSLGLRVDLAAAPRAAGSPLVRLRDALLLPLASRAWW